MKRIILPLYMFVFLFSSCLNEEIKHSPKEISTPILENGITALVNNSGLVELKRKNASWHEIHENYLKTIQTEKDNEFLVSYKSNLISHQILNTSLLNELNSDNYQILETYLDEMKEMNNPYPKMNYLALTAIKPYVDNDYIQSLAEISFNKGLEQKENKEESMKELVGSKNLEDEFKLGFEKNFKENYEVYLPKLKEL